MTFDFISEPELNLLGNRMGTRWKYDIFFVLFIPLNILMWRCCTSIDPDEPSHLIVRKLNFCRAEDSIKSTGQHRHYDRNEVELINELNAGYTVARMKNFVPLCIDAQRMTVWLNIQDQVFSAVVWVSMTAHVC